MTLLLVLQEKFSAQYPFTAGGCLYCISYQANGSEICLAVCQKDIKKVCDTVPIRYYLTGTILK
jgi:hypothetical protein